MINQNLHRRPTALDSTLHRGLAMALPVADWGVARDLNAVFVAAVEFIDVCREFPIVFVKAGTEPDGSDTIAPIAVLGLTQNTNLYVTGERWRAQYVPAVINTYPFCIAKLADERLAICYDADWPGAQTGEGQPLFDTQGQPSELMKTVQAQLEALEAEIQRTRAVCKRFNELGLLQPMRFDVTLPDGARHTVDGFLTLDDKKATALPDDVVCELHRNGLLGLMHLHWASMGNMRRLVDWHVERSAAAPAA
ncbi:MAG: SapC family protein [Rubrivivax sp.]